MHLIGKGFPPVDLCFTDAGLHRVCTQKHVMIRRVGAGADALAQLLNEIASAEALALVEQLPHVDLEAVATGRVAVTGSGATRVLLAPSASDQDAKRDPLYRSATAAKVLAVCAGRHDLNPQGESWS
jgi:hypothetical protein